MDTNGVSVHKELRAWHSAGRSLAVTPCILGHCFLMNSEETSLLQVPQPALLPS